MDQKHTENREIQRLIELGEASRSCLGSGIVRIKDRLDMPARLRGSLQHHPSAWLVGSLASGIPRQPAFPPSPLTSEIQVA